MMSAEAMAPADLGLARLVHLDKAVDAAEGEGLRARWEFGRELLSRRVGKQLPAGVLAEVTDATGKSEAELRYRMQFAEKYPTEVEVVTAVTTFRSWTELRESFSTTEQKAHVAHNAGDNEWYTPAEYIEAARTVMGAVDLDPASSAIANEVVSAETFYTAEDDGLSKDWAGRVWMNPPYARPLVDKFCAKLARSFAYGDVTQAITLTNNATETGWWQALGSGADAMAFPSQRVKFWHPDKESAPLQGQSFIYLGENVADFRRAFGRFGLTVTL